MPLSRRATVIAAAVCVVAGVTIGATGCAPDPDPRPSTATPTTTATPTPTPTPTEEPAALPGSCEQAYSASMLATLEAEVPPLNDPGISMLSTENTVALEILESGIATVRCTWGPPSERGIATNVSLVTAEQSAVIAAALLDAGFSESPFAEGTIYRIAREMIDQDDQVVSLGETHYLGAGGWVSTRWINVDPDGYTEDIVTTVWG